MNASWPQPTSSNTFNPYENKIRNISIRILVNVFDRYGLDRPGPDRKRFDR
jgi:hypothetical protein